MSTKKKAILLGVIVVAIGIVTVFLGSKIQINKTESAIDNIGLVTINSGSDIITAENLYNKLTDSQKGKVKNYSVLTSARYSFNKIKLVYDGIESLSNDDYIGASFVFENYEKLSFYEKTQITNFHKLEYYFCKEDGCTEIVRSPYGYEYCYVHRCKSIACQNGKRKLSDYCSEHACAVSNCSEEKRSSGNYCWQHRCQFVLCTNQVSGYSSYCSSHQCAVSWCTNGRTLLSIYCYAHD